jgi:hypothetical protein
MEDKKLKVDITSTAIEKGLDAAKGFLEKLITPAVEETGLLIKEHISYWRFKNQVKMLNKAQEYCAKNNISPKSISFKLLCPLLENASLEEEEILQDKWAILLSNLVDSEQNIENHVFPFLLGQISKEEFTALEKITLARRARIKSQTKGLDDLIAKKEAEALLVKENIQQMGSQKDWSLWQQNALLDTAIFALKKQKENIAEGPYLAELIPENLLQEFELANLVRLGLVRNISRQYAHAKKTQIENNPDLKYLTLDNLEISIDHEDDIYLLTELGVMFFDACTEKHKK